MSLSAQELDLLMPELSEVVGGLLRHVWSRHGRCLVLEVRQPGHNHYLQLSLEPGAQRANLVQGKPRQPPTAPSFVMLLRKWLTGARVLSLAQLGQDRILRLDFDAADPDPELAPDLPRPRRRVTLIAQLTGPSGNLHLLQEEGRLIASLLHHPQGPAHHTIWAPPPRPAAPPPSPSPLAELSPDGARSAALEEREAQGLLQRQIQHLEQDLLRRLKQQHKHYQRRLQAVERDLERAEQALEFRRYGELLQSAWGKVEPGATQATVPDYYSPEMKEVTLPLDPSLDLKGNIARYFKRYRKYHDAQDTILERLEDSQLRTERAQDLLEQTRCALQEAAGLPPEARLASLEALRDSLSAQGDLPAQRAQRQRRDQEDKRLPYRTFHDKKGRTILVGKGGKDNDALSLKVARGNDLWLHAHNWAGAHVVVRLQRDEEISEQLLLDAATLAAFYSKGRRDTVIEVLYTRAKHVRKPKGLPPGRVTVAGGKTLALRIEAQRLQRLLGREPDLQA